MEIKQATVNEIATYMRQEKNYLLSIGENYSHGLLDIPENEFACVKIHVLIVKESIVGFCLIPSYDETLLMRLYISSTKRRLGYATAILKAFPKIRHLSCVTNNKPALDLYLKNGFKISKQSKHCVIFEKWNINIIPVTTKKVTGIMTGF